jgi:hypothetical protein
VASGHTAIMDTGTTLIIGPQTAVNSIAADVGAKCYFLLYFLQELQLRVSVLQHGLFFFCFLFFCYLCVIEMSKYMHTCLSLNFSN